MCAAWFASDSNSRDMETYCKYKKKTVKQVVGKRMNKSDTFVPCRCRYSVELHGRVDGLYTLRSSHEGCHDKLYPCDTL